MLGSRATKRDSHCALTGNCTPTQVPLLQFVMATPPVMSVPGFKPGQTCAPLALRIPCQVALTTAAAIELILSVRFSCEQLKARPTTVKGSKLFRHLSTSLITPSTRPSSPSQAEIAASEIAVSSHA